MKPSSTPERLFYPKLFSLLPAYTRSIFWSDLASGLTVGIVALPLAIAFAIASGVPPERGLITAIVGGFLISALGGSRVQIGGPTGAFVVIVYGIVTEFGMNGLLVCTMMAGIILIAMGLLRFGAIMKYIPYPLTVGFTSGIAVIIASTQVRDALGLRMGALPSNFIEQLRAYASAVTSIDLVTTAVFLGSIAVIFFWPRFNRRIPGSIVAIVSATIAANLLGLPVETVGSRFGTIPTALPPPAFPAIDWSQVSALIRPAFTVAFLGGIESLLSATVADGMIEGRHRSNTELIGQGLANLAVPLFGGIPATGAIARTVTNVKSGGRTPVAGMIHAVTLLLIMMIFGRWAVHIPLCTLAAVLFVVAYHMSEWRAFRSLLKSPQTDVAVLMTTFLLTLVFDLTVAVEVGVVLAAFLFMKHMTDVSTIREIQIEQKMSGADTDLRHEEKSSRFTAASEGIRIFELEGALFFGVAQSIRETLDFGRPTRAVIFRMQHVLALDASGLQALKDLWRACQRKKIRFVLEGLRDQPKKAIEAAGFLRLIGPENIVASLPEALGKTRG